jgi:hypothetical protein
MRQLPHAMYAAGGFEGNQKGLRSIDGLMSRSRGERLSALTQTTMTTMSSSLPLEILDLIADHLHNEPATLKACCIVSKSWIHRTRKHLFARVEFRASKSHIELWKKAFPDPSTSPAHYALSLYICGVPIITAADEDVGGWIRTFHNVVRLDLECLGPTNDRLSLAPFHGLSPALRSLCLTATSLEVLDLICSFPLLEDLELVALNRGNGARNTPSTSPKLTGSLELRGIGGIRPAVYGLLALLDDLRFAKITLACLDEDVESTTNLVSRCSDTLESLRICFFVSGTFPSASTSG